MCEIANVFMYLEIEGESIDFQELESSFKGLEIFQAKKGEKIIKSKRHPEIYKIREHDFWNGCWECKQKEGQELDELISAFIDKYLYDKNYILTLHDRYDVNMYLSVYPVENQYYMPMPKKIMSRLVDINMDIGFSVSHLQEYYDGSYLDK
jgi:hypothetical protein